MCFIPDRMCSVLAGMCFIPDGICSVPAGICFISPRMCFVPAGIRFFPLLARVCNACIECYCMRRSKRAHALPKPNSASRHGIIPVPAPRVAAQNAFQCQPTAFQCAVFPQRLYGILRAGGRVAARRGRERRNAILVKLYQPYQQIFKGIRHFVGQCIAKSFSWQLPISVSAVSDRPHKPPSARFVVRRQPHRSIFVCWCGILRACGVLSDSALPLA